MYAIDILIDSTENDELIKDWDNLRFNICFFWPEYEGPIVKDKYGLMAD